MEDLILKGPITKYSMQSSPRTKEPVSELLKNYLDVSGVVFWGSCLGGVSMGGASSLGSVASSLWKEHLLRRVGFQVQPCHSLLTSSSFLPS